MSPRFKPPLVRSRLTVELRSIYEHSDIEFRNRFAYCAPWLDRRKVHVGQQLACRSTQAVHLPGLSRAASGDDLRP